MNFTFVLDIHSSAYSSLVYRLRYTEQWNMLDFVSESFSRVTGGNSATGAVGYGVTAPSIFGAPACSSERVGYSVGPKTLPARELVVMGAEGIEDGCTYPTV